MSFLDAKLSASEEKIFGDFLEDLAIFLAQKTLNASKSSSGGISFEYFDKDTKFLVSVKSGINWVIAVNGKHWKQILKNHRKYSCNPLMLKM